MQSQVIQKEFAFQKICSRAPKETPSNRVAADGKRIWDLISLNTPKSWEQWDVDFICEPMLHMSAKLWAAFFYTKLVAVRAGVKMSWLKGLTAYRNQYLQCKGLLMFCATCFVTSSDVDQGSTGWKRQLLGGLCRTLGEDRHFKMRRDVFAFVPVPFFRMYVLLVAGWRPPCSAAEKCGWQRAFKGRTAEGHTHIFLAFLSDGFWHFFGRWRRQRCGKSPTWCPAAAAGPCLSMIRCRGGPKACLCGVSPGLLVLMFLSAAMPAARTVWNCSLVPLC